MPDASESTVIELVNRMAGIEARLKSGEDKTDRIESMLHELVRNQNLVSQTSDDRIEKILADKLEPTKDQVRESRTKLDTLEAGRRYNLVSVACVCGVLFGVFTWFNNQASESTKQLITAYNTAERSDLATQVNKVENELNNKIDQNAISVGQLIRLVDGYPEFHALVTQQNATSLQDRSDQKARIDRQESAISDLNRQLSGLTSSVTQKFTEVETQFSADAQLRNVQFSDQQRTNAVMWNGLQGTGAKIPTYPTGPWYQPNVSQKNNGTQ